MSLLELFIQRVLAPIVAEIVVRLVDKYVKDAAYAARVEEAIRRAKAAQTPEQTMEAASALTKALNS